jgi:Tol biopolymer transport system component
MSAAWPSRGRCAFSLPLHPLFALCLGAVVVPGSPGQPAPEPVGPKLLLAFASVRERRDPPYPKVYFYEHDGVAAGKLVGAIDSPGMGINKTRADMHPSLSRDGRFCAFSAQFGVTDGARIDVWDRQEKKLLALPGIHGMPKVHQMAPSVSGDGKRVAFTAWAWPGGSTRWSVLLYDTAAGKLVDLPRLNGETSDQRMPALSGDGRFLAYASNAKGGVGLTDVYMYDLGAMKRVPLPGMNSTGMDVQPALGGDGRLVAFSSDRPGGPGGRDIHLYDREGGAFLPLPGLNADAHEQSPSLSADGRYVAFVSERLGGAGDRDVYLYDRQARQLLPTPGLNSKEDDFDPCVMVPPRQR